MTMRYMALDIGNKRIGVAVGSSEACIASPLTVITRRTVAQDAAGLLELAKRYEVDAVIVGLPRNSDGSEGVQARLTREYVALLGPRLALPIRFYDERYSTFTAMAEQRGRGLDERRGRSTLDASAAAVILQDFFDSNARPS
jgi:putative Holliday junction resolvase